MPPVTEVVFFDGFDELDAIAPFEVLTAAGFGARSVCVPGQAPEVRSAHGLQITVAGELGAPELVVVPGGGCAVAPRHEPWCNRRSCLVRRRGADPGAGGR